MLCGMSTKLLNIVARIPLRGYTPRQVIHLELFVNNMTGKTISEFKVQLMKVSISKFTSFNFTIVFTIKCICVCQSVFSKSNTCIFVRNFCQLLNIVCMVAMHVKNNSFAFICRFQRSFQPTSQLFRPKLSKLNT